MVSQFVYLSLLSRCCFNLVHVEILRIVTFEMISAFIHLIVYVKMSPAIDSDNNMLIFYRFNNIGIQKKPYCLSYEFTSKLSSFKLLQLVKAVFSILFITLRQCEITTLSKAIRHPL